MHKIVNWLRRPQVWGFFVSVAVMAIVSLAFFFPENFKGLSLNQHDMMQGVANSQELKEYYEATGHHAMWTNSLMSGMPAFQITPTYPSNSLFDWINSVYGLGLPSPSNLLFMMMLGFLIMMYCMGMRWQYALVGAVAWGLSSYYIIIIGAGHIWKFVCLSYIPPTIGGLALCYRRHWLSGVAITGLFTMMQLNANHPQMTYYFFFVMAAMAIAYLCQAIKAKKLKDWGLGTVALLAGGILGLGANLPNLYNTYEYAKETKRAQSELAAPSAGEASASAERPTGGLPYNEILNWSYGRSEMLSLLIPNIKGGGGAKPEGGRMLPLTMATAPGAENVPYDIASIMQTDANGNPYSISTLQFFSQYFNDSESTNGPVYVGAIICALFLLGCIIVKGPMKWALLAITVIAALLSLGYNMRWLSDLMIYHFPMYSKFRAVESILVIVEFTMPLLGIIGLCQFMAEAKENPVPKAATRALYIAFGVCAAICAFVAMAPSATGSAINSNDQYMLSQMGSVLDTGRLAGALANLRYAMVRADALRSLLFLGLAFIALWGYSSRKISAPVAIGALGVLVLVDLFGVDKRYLSSSSFAPNSSAQAQSSFTPDAIDQAIMAQGNGEYYRVLDIPGFGQPDRSYFHKMVGGYHAAKLNRYEDMINNAFAPALHVGFHPELMEDSIAALYGPDQQDAIRELQASYRALSMLNTRYVITNDKQNPLVLNPYAMGNAWLASGLEYVDGARAEMDALMAIDPAQQAVADSKFREALGADGSIAVSPGDHITLDSYAPDALEYTANTANGGLAVFSEVYFPWGWRATIDGEPAPLGRVDYILRALRLPPGEHKVAMVFDPESLHITGAVAYACIIIIYLLTALAIGAEAKRKLC